MATRVFTDEQRKQRKAEEQRKRRASEKGKAWTKEYYQRPEVKEKKRKASKLQKNVEMRRNWGYKKDFGISIEEYEVMYIKQNGLCLICKQEETNRRLSVDHCHETGVVRGLLCGNCNRGLGLFKDNENSLFRALDYIKSYK
jgi:nitrate reductase cytochrome c-type subunit